MTLSQSAISRRILLAGAVTLSVSACAKTVTPSKPSPTPSIDIKAANARFSALERKYGVRLGVYALATGTGDSVAYGADNRFAFCSTFKTLAAAAVLHRNPLSHLNKLIRYTKEEVNSISVIAEKHIATGLTIGQLCDAAIRYSDGTAGNLLMRDIGGPAQLTAYLRGLGDTTSRMDNYEPELNLDKPGDPRDTTTPRALAGTYQKLVLGDALPTEKRVLITDWLKRNTTGGRGIRAGLPKGWTAGDKTGSGDWGRFNNVAVVWPPGEKPLMIAIMTDRVDYAAKPQRPVVPEATSALLSLLRRR